MLHLVLNFPLIQSFLVKKINQEILQQKGIEIKFKSLDVNLISLTMGVKGFELLKKGEIDLSVDEINIRVQPILSYLYKNIVLQEVSIDGVNAQVLEVQTSHEDTPFDLETPIKQFLTSRYILPRVVLIKNADIKFNSKEISQELIISKIKAKQIFEEKNVLQIDIKIKSSRTHHISIGNEVEIYPSNLTVMLDDRGQITLEKFELNSNLGVTKLHGTLFPHEQQIQIDAFMSSQFNLGEVAKLTKNEGAGELIFEAEVHGDHLRKRSF